MTAYYSDDRRFTDYIHNNLALPKIYEPLGWSEVHFDPKFADRIDRDEGIDYVFKKGEEYFAVQERFRAIQYQNYNDFTIRYRRDRNYHADRVESEFYKIDANYFTYGITNCDKNVLSRCTSFIKFAIIKLDMVYGLINQGLIRIENNQMDECYILNEKMICPVKYNRDRSSSFVPIDIKLLAKHFGRELILSQKGYYE